MYSQVLRPVSRIATRWGHKLSKLARGCEFHHPVGRTGPACQELVDITIHQYRDWDRVRVNRCVPYCVGYRDRTHRPDAHVDKDGIDFLGVCHL